MASLTTTSGWGPVQPAGNYQGNAATTVTYTDMPKEIGALDALGDLLSQRSSDLEVIATRLGGLAERVMGGIPSKAETDAPRPVPNGKIEGLRAVADDLAERIVWIRNSLERLERLA